MARMNSSVAVLALFLVAGFLLQSQAQPGQHSGCCFSHQNKPVPLRNLEYYEIPSRCSFPAVVFYTKRGIRICADPKAAWTKDRMNKLPENGQQNTP
ncbi:C-C motif chemokine 5-like [Heteronotia binoei]|uniref:C-C motif chemokine 5-like n=1 Tax=Heteronotia binoei TaxID=13085 RepID=UPI00292D9CE7|nr:C-C motif chemokine 5-like [Heteronotia binoei]